MTLRSLEPAGFILTLTWLICQATGSYGCATTSASAGVGAESLSITMSCGNDGLAGWTTGTASLQYTEVMARVDYRAAPPFICKYSNIVQSSMLVALAQRLSNREDYTGAIQIMRLATGLVDREFDHALGLQGLRAHYHPSEIFVVKVCSTGPPETCIRSWISYQKSRIQTHLNYLGTDPDMQIIVDDTGAQ